MKSRSSDFGRYNGLSYRICYGLTEDGKMDYSTPHYEFHKNCNCEVCNRRLKRHEGLVNNITVTTDDEKRFPEVEKVINDYFCGKDHYIGRKYILFMHGCIEKKVCL